MNRMTGFFLGGLLVLALGAPWLARADDDERLDRDIDHDRARVDAERRDLRRDWGHLKEEEREGDWDDAARIRRDMRRDEWRLRHDERDLHGDYRERRELPDDDEVARYGWGRAEYGSGCIGISSRIANDRAHIDEIAPTGRHKKALRWYEDDLQKAERERAVCR